MSDISWQTAQSHPWLPTLGAHLIIAFSTGRTTVSKYKTWPRESRPLSGVGGNSGLGPSYILTKVLTKRTWKHSHCVTAMCFFQEWPCSFYRIAPKINSVSSNHQTTTIHAITPQSAYSATSDCCADDENPVLYGVKTQLCFNMLSECKSLHRRHFYNVGSVEPLDTFSCNSLFSPLHHVLCHSSSYRKYMNIF